MSDTFDHEGEAWASLDWYDGNDSEPTWNYNKDPLYYHARIAFKSIKAETEKAYLLELLTQDVWVPKKICRYLSLKGKDVMVHKATFIKILANKS